MTNLYEMMLAAQNGQAMQNLARQFGLSQQQTQSAIEALLPAFTMGLPRQTRDPYAFGSMAQMMAASPFGRIYDSNGDGIPDGAATIGTNVLGQLFGSPEVSRAVAAQAAATSGVSQAILKQMLPVIAAMVMGGLTKSLGNQGFGGILGQLGEMMQGRMPGAQPAGGATPANPLEAILGGMFGNSQGRGGAAPDGGLFGQILGGMLGGTAAAGGAQRPTGAEARPTPAGNSADPLGLDALNSMFESGRQVQEEHQSALQSIFDALLKGQSRR